MIIVVLVT